MEGGADERHRKKVTEAQAWLNQYGGEQGEKERWKRERLKLPPVPEPQIDGVTGEILNAYAVISRSRVYAGMAGAPLPLSMRDIEQYLSVRPIQLDRDEFEAAIFALDDVWRDEWAKKQEQDRKKK